jgi:hypothetical protein
MQWFSKMFGKLYLLSVSVLVLLLFNPVIQAEEPAPFQMVSGTLSGLNEANRTMTVSGVMIYLPALGDVSGKVGQEVTVAYRVEDGKKMFVGFMPATPVSGGPAQ